jgi:hypothetical protein
MFFVTPVLPMPAGSYRQAKIIASETFAISSAQEIRPGIQDPLAGLQCVLLFIEYRTISHIKIAQKAALLQRITGLYTLFRFNELSTQDTSPVLDLEKAIGPKDHRAKNKR